MDSFTKNDTNRIKGVATLMMLMHHCFAGAYMYEGYAISFFPFSEAFINNISWYGKLCVSIFAFCSGYGLFRSFQSNTSIKEWISKRMWSVYSNYWLIFIVATLTSLVINRLPLKVYYQQGLWTGHFNLLVDFLGLSNFFGTPSLNGAWWYLSLLITIILLIPFFEFCLRKFNYWAFLVIVIIPRVLGIPFQGNNSPLSFIFIAMLGVYFAMFNMFEKIENLQINRKPIVNESIILIAGFCLLVGTYITFINLPVQEYYEMNYGISPLVLILFLYRFVIRLPVIKSLLEMIGRRSGDIFYTHIFFRSYYADVIIYKSKHFLLSISILLLLSIGASITLDIVRIVIKRCVKEK